MNARVVATTLMLTAWVLLSPAALAAHMAAGGRSMCAGDWAPAPHASALHQPGHDANAMDETAGKLCSLGLCVTLISTGAPVRFGLSDEAHVRPPVQTQLMALLQIPDPVPKPLHLSA